jgi:hypothetical protein
MIAWLLPLAAIVGIVLEACVQPREPPVPRLRRLAIGGAIAAILALVLLLLTARPLSSAVATFALMATVVIVSNAKFRALREPLVFVDFAMLGQVLRHPHIFITLVGVLVTIVVAALLAAAIAAATILESPVAALVTPWPGARLAGVVAALAVLAVAVARAHRPLARWCWRLGPSLHPRTDIERFGLFGALLLTAFLSAGRTRGEASAAPPAPSDRRPPPATLPNIVAVQLESFYDARLMDPRFDQQMLPSFDAYAGTAALHGRLEVPAWGYTQRSEFAFLTGLADEDLGIDRYNPYARFARRPVWSVAHELRSLGYRTVCIHPFFGSFFGRDRVIPNLGFDRFLDISAFQGAARFGPYVSDQAVAEKAIALLEEPGAPLFIFIITIESHGTWRNNRLPAAELAAVRNAAVELPEPFLCYLRHLRNADRMIGQLAGHFERAGDGVLCAYGDHLPSFPALYRKMKFSDGRTDYLIWRANHKGPAATQDMHISALSRALLDVVRAPGRPAPSATGG